MNGSVFSLLGGIVLFLIVGWGVVSFCKTLRKSYRAIQQKEPIRTDEVVRSLVRSNIVILLAVSVIFIFTNEEITLYTVVVSLVSALRDISAIVLLSAFCVYQVHQYNAKNKLG